MGNGTAERLEAIRDESGWRALSAEVGSPAHRTRATFEVMNQTLDLLDAYFAVKQTADQDALHLASDEDLERFLGQVLESLRIIRDAASADIRELTSWAGRNTEMSTYVLGKAAGLSAATVSRDRKATP